MEVTLNQPTPPERKLKAVMCADGRFYFSESIDRNLLVIVSAYGYAKVAGAYGRLSDVLKDEPGATPIYEGDSVTITF